jgi:hypothetical protein
VRVLVIGSYPPPPCREARRTVAAVHRFGARGDDVDVLSTPGSAAQFRGPVAGPRGAWETWRLGRRYDAVVVHVERDAPLRTIHGRRARLDRVVDCFSWGFALRRLRNVTLVVEDTDVVHRSIGGRTGRYLWTAARAIQAGSEHARRRLIDEGGAPETRVELLPATTSATRHDEQSWDGVHGAVAIMEEVRRRAADDRRAVRRGALEPGV